MILQISQHINLYYETYGDKTHPSLLLLHGLGADHKMWQPQIDCYPQAGFFVIIPDLRGHGHSSLPEVFTIQDCAQDLHQLLTELGIEQAHVVGVSMGGMVAQQLAVDYPQNVATLTIVDSLSGVKRPVERFNAWLASVLLKVLPAKMQVSMIESTYRRMGKSDVGSYLGGRLASMDGAWVLHMRQQVNRFNLHNRLAEIRVPTLVLVGDQFGSLAVDMAQSTAKGIPGAVFQVLPGGGDPSNLLVSDLFDRALLDFVRHVAV